MYLSNKQLYVEIIVSKAKGKLSKKAEDMIMLLGERAIKKKRYNDSDEEMDCLHTGLLTVYEKWYNFDENITTNTFAYFTEIFKRATAKQFNDLYKKKGDLNGSIKTISIERANDGNGLHSI